jgi:hypothetical protein
MIFSTTISRGRGSLPAFGDWLTLSLSQGGTSAGSHYAALIDRRLPRPEAYRHGGRVTPGKGFQRFVFQELRQRGYDVVPINPHASDILGQRGFARVQDIRPPVDTVLLVTSPALTETVLEDCAEAGIRRVWMYRAGGDGAVSAQAVEFCKTKGIAVVARRMSVHVLAS